MTEAWAVVEKGVVIDSGGTDRAVPWWSFTKTVLAAAALVLVRDGVLALDEPLPDRPYTLRHLLQHRSGLADYGWLKSYHEAVARHEDPWSVPDLLKRTDIDRLRFPTGKGWEYSNVGYLFVRQLIETVGDGNLNAALHRLVFLPLGIEGASVALERSDLDGVEMGSAEAYHPGWVYHGLLVGPVQDAALLLDRFLAGSLLHPEQLKDMLMPYTLPGPIGNRPWMKPGYGLGVMTGEATGGMHVAGHTGGGPGSTIAVYQASSAQPARTAVYFATSEDQSRTEGRAFELLDR
ncbi:serine hydrolase domain-containing protein [Microvirga roseola]|uniref:serine hydrolase domain-containing protein n=1 Tax=Microvirga roseola TaxID=2883126 RepID=UPI001E45855B|nr:serine hydrolase domain-containing protein [Microvirga roseola]